MLVNIKLHVIGVKNGQSLERANDNSHSQDIIHPSAEVKISDLWFSGTEKVK